MKGRIWSELLGVVKFGRIRCWKGQGASRLVKDVLFGPKRTNDLFLLARGGHIQSWRAVLGDNGRIRTRKGQCLSGVAGWSGKGRTWPESVKFGFKG